MTEVATRHRSTQAVFDAHLEAAAAGDVERDIAENFAPDVVLLTGIGILRGHDGVRRSRAVLDEDMPSKEYHFLTRLVEGEHAFLEWEAHAEQVSIDDGADSFFFQDGLIRAQTIHYTVRHRTGYHARIAHGEE